MFLGLGWLRSTLRIWCSYLLWCDFLRCSITYLCSDHLLNSQDVSKHNLLEVGAAALLVGDMEAKIKGELWRNFGAVDKPYLDQLLQPSLLTSVTNSASARAHMRAITASKRSKTGSLQIWHVLLTQIFVLILYHFIMLLLLQILVFSSFLA